MRCIVSFQFDRLSRFYLHADEVLYCAFPSLRLKSQGALSQTCLVLFSYRGHPTMPHATCNLANAGDPFFGNTMLKPPNRDPTGFPSVSQQTRFPGFLVSQARTRTALAIALKTQAWRPITLSKCEMSRISFSYPCEMVTVRVPAGNLYDCSLTSNYGWANQQTACACYCC